MMKNTVYHSAFTIHDDWISNEPLLLNSSRVHSHSFLARSPSLADALGVPTFAYGTMYAPESFAPNSSLASANREDHAPFASSSRMPKQRMIGVMARSTELGAAPVACLLRFLLQSVGAIIGEQYSLTYLCGQGELQQNKLGWRCPGQTWNATASCGEY